MAYRLSGNKDLEADIQRIADELVARALRVTGDSKLRQDKAIHEARKCIKMLRGLVRLADDGSSKSGGFTVSDAHFRDAAKELSAVRDAAVAIETLESLNSTAKDRIGNKKTKALRSELVSKHRIAASRIGDGEGMKPFRRSLRKGYKSLGRLSLPKKKYKAALPDRGFDRTYRRARKMMKKADKDRSPDLLHRWRRHTKYHYYHAKLLAGRDVPGMTTRVRNTGRLGKLLGEHHDLIVLEGEISAFGMKFGVNGELNDLTDRLRAAAEDKEEQAFRLGKRLFAEKRLRLG